MTTQHQLADAYYLAAKWHDKQAKHCRAIVLDEPRIGFDDRRRASVAEKHHAASAAGLRLAATNLVRSAIERPTTAP